MAGAHAANMADNSLQGALSNKAPISDPLEAKLYTLQETDFPAYYEQMQKLGRQGSLTPADTIKYKMIKSGKSLVGALGSALQGTSPATPAPQPSSAPVSADNWQAFQQGLNNKLGK